MIVDKNLLDEMLKEPDKCKLLEMFTEKVINLLLSRAHEDWYRREITRYRNSLLCAFKKHKIEISEVMESSIYVEKMKFRNF